MHISGCCLVAMSWVFHATGLPADELNRTHLQLVGCGIRPAAHTVDPSSPPAGLVTDAQGCWWEPSTERARHIDSVSRDLARGSSTTTGLPGNGGVQVTPKLRLDCMQGAKNGLHALLLPDLVRVHGGMWPPMCLYTTDGPPGLPLPIGVEATRPKSEPSASPATSTRHTKLSAAHTIAAQRRMRFTSPEHFCLVVPCVRVVLGSATLLDQPGLAPDKWPRFVSGLVLGGRVDGKIVPPAKLGTKKAAKATGEKDDSQREIWHSTTGEQVVLNFHGAPFERERSQEPLPLAKLLEYIDKRWVHKVSQFPVAWSLLWVETLDTQAVIQELHGEGPFGARRCSVCRSPFELLTRGDGRSGQFVKCPSPRRTSAGAARRTSLESPKGPRSPRRPSAARRPSAQARRPSALQREASEPDEEEEDLLDPTLRAWEDGRLPCARCGIPTHEADRAQVCPHFAERQCSFRALCAECCLVLEQIAKEVCQPPALEDADELASGRRRSESFVTPQKEPWQEEEEEEEKSQALCGGRPRCTHLPFAADVACIASHRDVCLGAELELRVEVGTVPPERRAIFVDKLRDEIRRALLVPSWQIFFFPDDGLSRGIVQIGLVHPDIAPTKLARRACEPDCPGAENPAFDLTQLWDRLVLAVAGDSGQHRFHRTHAFQLLSRTQPSALRWVSAIVAPHAEHARLVAALRDLREPPADLCDDAATDRSSVFGSSLGFNADDSRAGSPGDAVLTSPSLASALGQTSEAKSPATGRETASPDIVTANASPIPILPQVQPPEQSGDGVLRLAQAVSPRVSPAVSVTPRSASGLKSVRISVVGSCDSALVSIDRPSKRCRAVPSKLRPAGLRVKGSFPKAPTRSLEGCAASGHARASQRWRAAQAHLVGGGDAFSRLPEAGLVGDYEEMPLHQLARTASADVLLSALARATPADINAGDPHGRRPLHIVAMHRSAEIVRIFTQLARPEGPVSLEVRDKKGRTPLHYSAYRGETAVVACFVEVLGFKRLDRAEAQTGETAMLIAARAGYADVLRLLVEGFASVTLQNRRGLTPLHYAAAAGASECCQLLLEARSEPEVFDKLGRSSQMWAEDFEHKDVADLLAASSTAVTGQVCAMLSTRTFAESTVFGTRSAFGGDEAVSVIGHASGGKAQHEQLHPQRVVAGPGVAPKAPPSTALTAARGVGGRQRLEPLKVNSARQKTSFPQGTPASARRAPAAAGGEGGGGDIVATLLPAPSEERQALLQGQGIQDGMSGVRQWSGDVGSLAVRWRCWAHTVIADPDSVDALEAPSTGASKILAPLPPVLAGQATAAEPLERHVAEVAERLGGHFCTRCWEHVLEGHDIS